ncbi:glycosyltransferase 61 family protein [Dapis sp. BLCC M126]|uniref:glycosyltransferase 61 family protein n=1 Tax=Dapis sp. BLCC M126 TaxID=3400189 RepID=UPI003CF70038
MSDIENQETLAFNFKQKAERYLSQGKLDEAYANCSKALEILPNSGEIYKILGNISQRMGQFKSAKKSYKQAIKYNPNLAEAHANLGSISARKKQWKRAIKYYEKAISLQPYFPGFYRNLAKIWQCLGEHKLATECSHKALSLETKYDSKINKKEIFSASEVNLLASQTINCQTERIFQSRKVYSQTAFVTVIPEGKGFANVGVIAVMTPENKLVAEVSTGNTELISSPSELPTIYNIEGTVAFLSIKWGKNNYFHWMFDIITRIYLLRLSNLKIDKIVVNECNEKFQLETLESLGISQDKIIESENYPYIKAEQLLVPSFSYSDGKYLRIPKWGCDFLRNSFLPEETKEKIYHQTKRIYLSRKQASRRKVINEEKVINFLEKFGFESIALGSISVAEQAVLLASAKFVIAPHGAALTNLVFCNPGTKVIEIFAPDYLVKYYWIVSNVCGLEYYYLLGEQFEEKSPSEPAKKNIFVDLQKLLSLMKLAEII